MPKSTPRSSEASAHANGRWPSARAYLLARLKGGERAQVRLRDIRYGKYAGRVLARVETAGGEDLGQGLMAAGLARPYDGRARVSWCEEAGAPSSG